MIMWTETVMKAWDHVLKEWLRCKCDPFGFLY